VKIPYISYVIIDKRSKPYYTLHTLIDLSAIVYSVSCSIK
jgi:hypothetical protein